MVRHCGIRMVKNGFFQIFNIAGLAEIPAEHGEHRVTGADSRNSFLIRLSL
jgi:hypothetical protein